MPKYHKTVCLSGHDGFGVLEKKRYFNFNWKTKLINRYKYTE